MAKVNTDDRVKTAITGMDELLSGGLIRNTLTLLTGTTGTGKTIYCCQYLYNGVTKFNENSVFFTFEEPPENIKRNVKSLGMDFGPLEKQKKILFVRYDPYHIEDVYELIETNIKKMNAKRVVIDSISALGLYVRDTPELRRMILNISLLLRKLKCTSVLTSEILPSQKSLSRFGVEEFITDNIIVLYYLRSESQYSRSITVWKTRGSEHSQKLHPYKIIKKGFVVYPKEEAFIKF